MSLVPSITCHVLNSDPSLSLFNACIQQRIQRRKKESEPTGTHAGLAGFLAAQSAEAVDLQQRLENLVNWWFSKPGSKLCRSAALRLTEYW